MIASGSLAPSFVGTSLRASSCCCTLGAPGPASCSASMTRRAGRVRGARKYATRTLPTRRGYIVRPSSTQGTTLSSLTQRIWRLRIDLGIRRLHPAPAYRPWQTNGPSSSVASQLLSRCWRSRRTTPTVTRTRSRCRGALPASSMQIGQWQRLALRRSASGASRSFRRPRQRFPRRPQ